MDRKKKWEINFQTILSSLCPKYDQVLVNIKSMKEILSVPIVHYVFKIWRCVSAFQGVTVQTRHISVVTGSWHWPSWIEQK